ncbi:ABC transporter ATP-binding protein [Arcticibacterium luteifluviistationis]|uniref:ABC transporter ATP-binding protein n=1 Tax=Arcticibacterium luteifluviistationis TaxID=1784714 RepID=A0A2Z4GAX5_9BACT|nr:ABC transporter ATP-binding protein [Arcticibacterium luteifluviistationis]AWV98357.1 ABC transporter ATP-binding protein [Arcticibacterium luteifluviistationis]
MELLIITEINLTQDLTKVLEVQNLNFSIEDNKIVDDVSLSLKKHQILALLGQSGSGKSTILKLIAGLLEPNSGSLLIDSESITPPSGKLIPGHPKIKIVRQDNPLFPNISLRENIEYELRFFNDEYKAERVEKLLKVTGLKKAEHQLPRHSSEGEQQRAAIARALADEPSLLLLDEPFSNLDYKNKSTLKEEVKQLVAEENMACIFVTHDISDVFGTADQLAILKKGKITQIDEPLKVYNYPSTTYEASISGEFNVFKRDIASHLFGITTPKKRLLIRPEAIKISFSGKHKANITAVTGRGVYKELTLEIETETLKCFTMETYDIGDDVLFDILRYADID